MRVTSDIWVHVFLRKEANRGAFSTIAKKGATEAGAIFVIENRLEGVYWLYGPAPQSLIEDDADERQFETVLSGVEQEQVDVYLARQMNFDPDIWIVETECRQGPPPSLVAGDSLSP